MFSIIIGNEGLKFDDFENGNSWQLEVNMDGEALHIERQSSLE